MSTHTVQEISQRIEELPTLPAIAHRISYLLDDETVDYRKIAALIEQDPPLAVKILRIANSPLHMTLSKVHTIEHALAILGANELRSILSALAVYDFFQQQESNGFDRRGFWRHAIVCSQIAKYLANHFRCQDDAIFLSGLIHDIGKIVFDAYFRDDFKQILTLVASRHQSFSKAEKEVLGVTHYQVAAKLLHQWDFPPQVVSPVLYHHAPWHDRDYPCSSIVIYLANIFAKIIGYPSLKAEEPTTAAIFSNPKLLKFLSINGFELNPKKVEVMIGNLHQTIHRSEDNILHLFD
ncbi:HDOD domain-containing protein [Desulfurivibrio alkaliphilus]|uniref:Putative signal transduction protein n=1 Tax=Desulfurivibrio alkaliphilus (strain DSM 19089 / UNIQEM U267 / AHT2) TaxID=589865 RepID=D6Z051_DESAT|nr:HDOD domain-containing protein [Desulfurivibrio alkaliphilus]ADH87084.1 putative signal transduction protein [Desulfurivibrio alkaliphilus AHT 2]